MTALTPEGQTFFDHGRSAIPRWVTEGSSPALEWLYALAHVTDQAHTQASEWRDCTYISLATDRCLDQHALDRGMTRGAGEDDAALRARIQKITDSATEPALIAGVDQILDAAGIRAIFRTHPNLTTGWNSTFRAKKTTAHGGHQTELRLSTVSAAVHPPTLTENSTTYLTTINYSSGVTTRADIETLVDAQSSWFEVDQVDSVGSTALLAGDAITNVPFYLSKIVNVRRDGAHFHTTGNSRAYLTRGFRIMATPPAGTFVVILPYPTSAGVAEGILQYVLKFRAAGFGPVIERRTTP